MLKITSDDIVIHIDKKQLASMKALYGAEARQVLGQIWGTDMEDLSHYHAVFYRANIAKLDGEQSFVTLSYASHGYIADADEAIDIAEAQKQIEIDLEIINREAQWTAEESIYFDRWWPSPRLDKQRWLLEFGVSLKDFHQKVLNRTLNLIILTRYGHILLNYSLSEEAINANRPLSYYQKDIDEIIAALSVAKDYRYQDVDEDNDMPSRSRLINLILSSEIF